MRSLSGNRRSGPLPNAAARDDGVEQPKPVDAPEGPVPAESPYRLVVPELDKADGVVDSAATEAFVRLKSLLCTKRYTPSKVIIVTSPLPADGKSFVSINLARAFAESSETRTLLIEADLRRPTITTYIDPHPERGLAEVLAGKLSFERAVCKPKNSPVHLLPGSRFQGEPTTLLSSSAFARLIENLRDKYERILLDTPPITLFSDADVVGEHADGALLVVRSGATPSKLVERAIGMIHTTRVLGTVLNAATSNLVDSMQDQYQHDYYYQKYYPKKDR